MTVWLSDSLFIFMRNFWPEKIQYEIHIPDWFHLKFFSFHEYYQGLSHWDDTKSITGQYNRRNKNSNSFINKVTILNSF